MTCNSSRKFVSEEVRTRKAGENFTRPATATKGKVNIKINRDFLRGPGSAIKWITIHRYHASPCHACHETAREMDKVGVDHVLENLDEYAQRLHENAQKKMWNHLLDAVAYKYNETVHGDGLRSLRELILEGVKLHQIEVKKKAILDTPQ